MNSNEAYKPIQQSQLSMMSQAVLALVSSTSIKTSVSHETALAIWKIELPSGSEYSKFAWNLVNNREPLPAVQSKQTGQSARPGQSWQTDQSVQPAQARQLGQSASQASRSRSGDSRSKSNPQQPFSQSGETQMQWGNRANANLQSDGSIPYGSHISQAKYTLPIHTVVQSRTQRAPQERAPNVKQHVWQGLRPEHVRIIQGVPVLLPVPTWALMVKGQSIGESVSVAESLIRHHYATRESLIDFVQTTDVPCRQKCLDVSELVQSGSDSPKETEMRLALLLCGMPFMIANGVIPGVVFENGAPIRLDLVDYEHRIGLDYQGDHHRTDRNQWRNDQNKQSRLAAAGWTVITVTQLNLSDEAHRTAFVMDVARALSRATGQPWTVTTPQPWKDVIARARNARRRGLLK